MIEAGSPEDLENAALQWEAELRKQEAQAERLVAVGWPDPVFAKGIETCKQAILDLRTRARQPREELE